MRLKSQMEKCIDVKINDNNETQTNPIIYGQSQEVGQGMYLLTLPTLVIF